VDVSNFAAMTIGGRRLCRHGDRAREERQHRQQTDGKTFEHVDLTPNSADWS
jgi:hypothetical protein